MATVLLIDLSSTAHPIWHTSQGEADPNVIGQRIAAKVLEMAKGYDHVAVCCDSGRSFRRDIDPSYKANRPEQEAGLQHQIDRAKDLLAAAGYPIWAVKGAEADDLIASATAQTCGEGVAVMIATADKDLLQLVGEHVQVLSVTKGDVLGVQAVIAKFGVSPSQMLDYLSLVGDASDNIVGAKGIGPKTAAKLLQAHDSLDKLYDRLESADVAGVTPAVRASLEEFLPRLETVRQLITLRNDYPIDLNALFAPRVPKTETPKMMEDDDMPTYGAGPITINEDPVQTPDVLPPTPKPERDTRLAPMPAEWTKQLEPQSYREARLLAEDINTSRIFIGSLGCSQAVLAQILAGRELGMTAMASLRAIHMIKGKPTLPADLIRAMVIRSGLAKFFRCSERTDTASTWETQRGEDPKIELRFTVEDAERAGLVKADSGWITSPADMCVARASVKLARLVYPDVVHGIYATDELLEAKS